MMDAATCPNHHASPTHLVQQLRSLGFEVTIQPVDPAV
jgi:hypothetical protein